MAKKGLSINQIKLIAAVSMLVDHIGYIIFPEVTILRVLGRLAFPLFAFCIAEGCRYTKNRLRYWLQMAICAVVFQVVAFAFTGAFGFSFRLAFYIVPMNVFGSFSVGILLCYLFDVIKTKKMDGYLLFLLTIFIVYVLSRYINFDYGFVGMLVPLSVYVFEQKQEKSAEPSLDLEPKAPASNVGKWARFLCFTLALLALSAFSGWGVQYYCLFAVPILSFYGGHYGSKKYKYWFYVFYPAHLILIYLIGLMLG